MSRSKYYADERTERITIRLTPELHKRVVAWAEKHNKTKTDLIEAAILAKLDQEAEGIGIKNGNTKNI